jgi:ribonuclease HII
MTEYLKKNDELLANELKLASEGFSFVAGVDEAGRGPLAGPVTAAAVILPADVNELPGVFDSKQLKEGERDELFDELYAVSGIRISVASATPEEIDRLNILRATHLAMRRAAEGLSGGVDFCLIDGLPVPGFPLPSLSIVKGDARCLSIAAASILAKVWRDHYMNELHREFPAYGFDRHAGYGTKAHMQAIHDHGVTIHHRRSFAPVTQLELPLE